MKPYLLFNLPGHFSSSTLSSVTNQFCQISRKSCFKSGFTTGRSTDSIFDLREESAGVSESVNAMIYFRDQDNI